MNQPKINLNELQHLAKLARIELSPVEENLFLPQIESILEYVDILSTVDTTNVETTSHVTGLKNILRSDEIKPSLDQAKAVSTATKTHNGFIVVPNTIKK